MADVGTVIVENGSMPNWNDLSFNDPNTYWYTACSGDANNNATKSVCIDEQFVIAPRLDLAVTKVGRTRRVSRSPIQCS